MYLNHTDADADADANIKDKDYASSVAKDSLKSQHYQLDGEMEQVLGPILIIYIFVTGASIEDTLLIYYIKILIDCLTYAVTIVCHVIEVTQAITLSFRLSSIHYIQSTLLALFRSFSSGHVQHQVGSQITVFLSSTSQLTYLIVMGVLTHMNSLWLVLSPTLTSMDALASHSQKGSFVSSFIEEEDPILPDLQQHWHFICDKSVTCVCTGVFSAVVVVSITITIISQ
ncbi:uncharacterized protein EV420DRAFT_1639271 [Desarmillaria tabescens]|uniref:Uncharacterized protein n=1 Tax=Armillaria tabescens TaxID=1929756 RepID=A0AA39NCV7_ARMTA|nr:uncharacterized protein EV420DRAFT_1639271 [Desarmillaria tabescens]KAK0463163.1 hypothetical protein EV420DRAFT_1639271 [Desarmillaria tabescens]